MQHLNGIVWATVLALASLGAAAEGQAREIRFGHLVIHHPWARQPPVNAGVMSGFMKITNTGDQDDRLLAATVEIAPVVQLHDMRLDGDVMVMAELRDGIAIPAGATVELGPKSLHVKFMGIRSAPMAGQEIAGTLTFEKAGIVAIDYEVEPPAAGMN